MKKTSQLFFGTLLVLQCLACSNDSHDAKNSTSIGFTNDPNMIEFEILATVNGEAITQNDIDHMIERMFSGSRHVSSTPKMQDKILQSLIASKAMAQAMKKSLDPEKNKRIQQDINAYGEELYVKEYLIKNASPQPVTTSMVQDYYAANLQEFGAGGTKIIELLKTTTMPTEAHRDKILSAVAVLKNNPNWKQYTQSSNNDMGLVYHQSKIKPGLFDARIEQAVAGLKAGGASNVVFVRGIPHILRLLETQTTEAKALSAVSSQIRKKLAALQLKKAIKKASQSAKATSDIVLKSTGDGNG